MRVTKVRYHRAPVIYELDSDEGTIRFDAGVMPASAWMEYDKVLNNRLVRMEMVEPLPIPAPMSLSAQFIAENFIAINAAKRGHMKPAPWYLRWLYDSVVDKEPFYDD